MAYDEGLAQRLREQLQGRMDVTEKKMFGGLAFLRRGHMFAGIAGDRLMARVGPEKYAAALAQQGVSEMDFTGRPMKGYVFVDAPAIEADAKLELWVRQCFEFVGTLPDKVGK